VVEVVEVVVLDVVVVEAVEAVVVETVAGVEVVPVAAMDVVTNPADAIGEMIDPRSGEQERPSQADARRATRSRTVPRQVRLAATSSASSQRSR